MEVGEMVCELDHIPTNNMFLYVETAEVAGQTGPVSYAC